MIAVHALAYEVYNDPFVTDKEYDKLAREINKDIPTDNPKLDAFFKKHYTPDSGQWVYMHPEKTKLHALYRRIKTVWRKGPSEEYLLDQYIKANEPLRSVSTV